MCPEKSYELSIVPNYLGDELTIVEYVLKTWISDQNTNTIGT